MLSRIRKRLRDYRGPDLAGDWPEAAVLLPLTDQLLPDILLTVRSAELSSHAGEVAFPGGRRDPADAHLQETALRETEEELGIPPVRVEILGELQPRLSKAGIKVTPFVGLLAADQPVHCNPREIEATFTAPMTFFQQRRELHIQTRMLQGKARDVPWYDYRGRQVWGLTAVVIVDFLNVVSNFGVELRR